VSGVFSLCVLFACVVDCFTYCHLFASNKSAGRVDPLGPHLPKKEGCDEQQSINQSIKDPHRATHGHGEASLGLTLATKPIPNLGFS